MVPRFRSNSSLHAAVKICLTFESPLSCPRPRNTAKLVDDVCGGQSRGDRSGGAIGTTRQGQPLAPSTDLASLLMPKAFRRRPSPAVHSQAHPRRCRDAPAHRLPPAPLPPSTRFPWQFREALLLPYGKRAFSRALPLCTHCSVCPGCPLPPCTCKFSLIPPNPAHVSHASCSL